MPRPLTIVCASALLLAVAAPAFAQHQQRVVELGDVNTYSDRGADVAVERIEDASRSVCNVQGGAQPIPQRVDGRECAIETAVNTVSDLANPVITARYYGYSPNVVIEDDSGVVADPYPYKYK